MSLGTSGTLAAHTDLAQISPQAEVATFCGSSGGWLPLICSMNLTASLLGMTSANLTRANLCRAVLEGTCFSLRYGLDLLREVGLLGQEIRLVGGAAKSPLWCSACR